MPVLVPDAGRDETHLGSCRGEEGGGGARLRAVVADLQQVDVGQQRTCGEQRLDGSLGVAGQQRAESATAQQHDERSVVDVVLEEWRGSVRDARVKDLDTR
jgi:hypothetical protein